MEGCGNSKSEKRDSMAAPCGSWKSSITADQIARGAVRLAGPRFFSGGIAWLESRPAEKGRFALVGGKPGTSPRDLLESRFNIRSTVNEYGGGAWTVGGGRIIFVNHPDGNLYKLSSEERPVLLLEGGECRFGDLHHDPFRNRIICIRESPGPREGKEIAEIVAIDARDGKPMEVLVGGDDFYSSPRVSPDGTQLAWLSWNHPSMPWDETLLHVACIDKNGKLSSAGIIAGGDGESVFQPEWSPDGRLHFVSDRNDWWNIYFYDGQRTESVCEMNHEFGRPQWIFGMSTYAFVDSYKIICAFNDRGLWRLGEIDRRTKRLSEIKTEYTEITEISAEGSTVCFTGAGPTRTAEIVELTIGSRRRRVMRKSLQLEMSDRQISRPEILEFPTTGGQTAYGFYYPPVGDGFIPIPEEKPPLIVKCHGGPTHATAAVLKGETQFWTSRGFGVLDVNYRGSNGYGREYRRMLYGNWGIYDAEDCVAGADHLCKRGLADERRLVISGGSAGGYTVLCALAFHDIFRAGAVYYGISDLQRLLEETHKFESHYTETLVGKWPEQRELYHQRSPLYHSDRIQCPVIFFQGLEDKVVPPEQSESMFKTLKTKGVMTAYLTFEGEQHGFRQARNIKRSLEAELFFYSRVFGFEPDDNIEPPLIFNES